ncbi:MAG: hypothetical protein ACREF1_01170, partial [Acetobacteraceae bacterium]
PCARRARRCGGADAPGARRHEPPRRQHAQQDVLDQLYLDAAEKAWLEEDVRLVLERVAAISPVPPARRSGYAAAARRVGFA